jgi:NAD(P) transhydrogenase subunit beta
MALALAATIWLTLEGVLGTARGSTGLVLLAAAVLVGGGIGLWRARVVEMTGMPELIALLHSFVGLAAVLVGWNGHLQAPLWPGDLMAVHHAEVFIGVFIGAVTFTGSIVAFLKLSARMKSAPLMLPGKNAINLGALAAFVALTVWYVNDSRLELLIAVTVLAFGLGWHLVASIGGGDMPVVVSMLNSYSGLGRGRGGFPAQQRPAHHHRRPGRLLRRLPFLHHVPGDEPLVHLGDRRRVRHRSTVSNGRRPG